jgi:hypothetical protein
MFGLCSIFYETGELMYKGNLVDSTLDSDQVVELNFADGVTKYRG